MDSVIGFAAQKEYFQSCLAKGRLNHAYLLVGPEEIGKRTFALELYRSMNGAVGEYDADFCMVAVHEGSIAVEDIRNVRTFLSRTPARGPYQCVVIDHAETMTEEATNALLKILEEPPKSAVLILITAHEHLLLPTIRSRCEKVAFAPHNTDVIEHIIVKQKVSKEDGDFLRKIADGRIGWVLNLCKNQEKLTLLRAGVQEFQSILKKGTFERLQYAAQLAEREDSVAVADLWLRWARVHGNDPAKTAKVLHDLIELRYLLTQSQYNHRLAIERFLLSV